MDAVYWIANSKVHLYEACIHPTDITTIYVCLNNWALNYIYGLMELITIHLNVLLDFPITHM